ncbi:hypothetical protein BDB00DRAFT_834858 [Zychaea mexicana]|uniref:uncharacterized protein n=1 Tax=Zychaea mexicana TaxID=64656 RepID=UPI0022FEC595|nr:uncharacterized protein BDB00DRAFT_834858 [Zychaea mexicana]KAI9491018.1 hypothetical protein BDB00DRAFT_834858 [Zychaea mexicana]
MYISYVLKRFDENDLLHAETLCLGTDGITISTIILQELISGAKHGAISQSDITMILEAQSARYLRDEFIESEELILEAARLLKTLMQVVPTRDTSVELRTRTAWLGLTLCAASAIRQNVGHVAMADTFLSNLGSTLVIKEVNQAIQGWTAQVF